MDCVVDFFARWQTLTAGLLALVAAIITVFGTSRIEQRKAAREIESLRRSIGMELRLLTRSSLSAHKTLKDRVQVERPITAFEIEHSVRLPAPIVYTSNAHRISLLEDDAISVMAVYGMIALARDTLSGPLLRYLPANNIPPLLVDRIAAFFMDACNTAAGLLLRLRTGIASQDDLDDALIRDIRNQASS
jgi:hypothetical protein